MSLFSLRRQHRDPPAYSGYPLIPMRQGSMRAGAVDVTEDKAMRHDAVWACLRLRANLLSTFPVDVFRDVGPLKMQMPKSSILVEPGGTQWRYLDWLYASNVDRERAGNTIGLITERNALGLPSRIDLQLISRCTVIQKKNGTVQYRIDGTLYPSEQVWHKRMYPVAGLAVGLSPIAYAAWTIGEYLSAQHFALDWFGSGGVPKARLRNTKQRVAPKEGAEIKERWRAAVSNGDLFVHGFDWEYELMQAETMGIEWLDIRRFGLSAICRFFDCPADLIDAAISAPGTLTYASISQRNLQFLIMGLNSAVVRWENDLSELLPKPRYVKMNTDAMLRMDPETREKVIMSRVAQRRLTVTEARALENLAPLTPEQEAEFDRLFGAPRTAPVAAGKQRDALENGSVPGGSTLELGREPVRAIATVGQSMPAWEERQ